MRLINRPEAAPTDGVHLHSVEIDRRWPTVMSLKLGIPALGPEVVAVWLLLSVDEWREVSREVENQIVKVLVEGG